MWEYLTIFLISVASSFHCVGMCGGIAGIHAEATAASGGRALRAALYHLGRIWSYLFIGLLFGALGAFLWSAERLLALAAGTFMIWTAILGLRIEGEGGGGSMMEKGLLALFGWVKGQKGLSASLYLGLFNGLLPCSLVYAFAAKAASAGSPLSGMLTMASFGLGTVPALFLSGKIVRSLSPKARSWFVSVGTFFILVLGAVTLLRGFPAMPGHG